MDASVFCRRYSLELTGAHYWLIWGLYRDIEGLYGGVQLEANGDESMQLGCSLGLGTR